MATAVLNSVPHDTNMGAMPLEENPRMELLQRLRGAHVVIPDLQKMIAHWPGAQSAELARLDDEVDKALRRIFTLPQDEVRFRKYKSSKIAEFACVWWPYAKWDALLTATYMSIFLFIWDDEIDAKEFSTIAADYNAAASFRATTVVYMKASLSGASSAELAKISTNPIIASFEAVGKAVLQAYDEDHVHGFLDELLFFIRMCEEEQKIFDRPTLPSVEEYMERRMGSSAVRVFFAITEYACGVILPKEVRNDETMERIWHEANIIISITNDVLSMKKEIAHSQVVDSVIPLLMVTVGSAQAAIERAEVIVRSSVQALDRAAEQILEREFSSPEVHEDVRKFIDGIKYACTANLNWSLTSGRYELNCASMEGGMPLTL
ncbi:terpenoid synthase [Xylariaceae sp. FL1272]|nr:terpenoid synthase [Xylariaceae sp. FL1272]